MKIDIEKLIGDLKRNFEINMENGDVCSRCRMQHIDNADRFSETEVELGLDQPNCETCGFNDCETLSEKYRTYRMCAAWRTMSWLEFAFSDVGADFLPKSYGFTDYYADQISSEEEAVLDAAMEAYCLKFKEQGA